MSPPPYVIKVVRLALLWVACLVLGACSDSGTHLLDDFEQNRTWEGLTRSSDHVKQGAHAGRWDDFKGHSSVRLLEIPTDWSDYNRLTFWLYSSRATARTLTVFCTSENKEDSSGWDYYTGTIRLDWQGWKLVSLQLGHDLSAVRHPRGWDQIDALRFHIGGESPTGEDTALYFDEMRLVRDSLQLRVADRKEDVQPDGSIQVDYEIQVSNQGDRVLSGNIKILPRTFVGEERAPVFKVEPAEIETGPIQPGGLIKIPVRLTASSHALQAIEPLSVDTFELSLHEGSKNDLLPSQILLSVRKPLPKRQHPFLFGGEEIFARARTRAQKFPWARRIYDNFLEQANKLLEEEFTVPLNPGGNLHQYACQFCGNSLRYIESSHVCPKCDQEFSGKQYDNKLIWSQHYRNSHAVINLSIAYYLTGRLEYAQKSANLLTEYAKNYRKSLHFDTKGDVIVAPWTDKSAPGNFGNTLELKYFVWAYDLLYEMLPVKDRDLIENGFFRPAAQSILLYPASRYNIWAAWYSAVAVVGFCLEDESLILPALDNWTGFQYHLNNSLVDGGFWWEGAMQYHYLALDSMRWATEAAWFAGINFYNDLRYRSLFEGPIEYVFPDGTFPAVNDSYPYPINKWVELYEIAYARTRNPAFLQVIGDDSRDSLGALLWGVETLPPIPKENLGSMNFPGIGAAILRLPGSPEEIAVHIDYGPHGGGHGHPDKLGIILYANGKVRSPDPGTTLYGSPLIHSWYRTTLAHNTIIVDEENQQETKGVLLDFHSEDTFSYIEVACDTAYERVELSRRIFISSDYLVDIFTANSKISNQYDLAFHNYGKVRSDLPLMKQIGPLGTKNGYQHVTQVRMLDTEEAWQVDFVEHDAAVRLHMSGAPGTTLFFGEGIANSKGSGIFSQNPVPCPMVVVRRTAKETKFVSLIEPYRGEPSVASVHCHEEFEGDTILLEIAFADGRSDWLMLTRNPGVSRTFKGVTTKAKGCLLRIHRNGEREITQFD